MSKILKRGSKGDAVKSLQTTLRVVTANPLNIDGHFGPATESAVKQVQKRYGLAVDGIVGPQTLHALNQAVTRPSDAVAEPDKSAMQNPNENTGRDGSPKRPPNGASLKLLDTSRRIDTIFIHCTATPEGKDYSIEEIRSWHKQRGFTDIGYHYVVARDGTVMVGRPIGQVGAHVSGHNTGSIGISYIGGVAKDGKTAKDTRTPEQIFSLLWLTEKLVKKFGVKQVRGHNEVANKACPSFNVQSDALGQIV